MDVQGEVSFSIPTVICKKCCVGAILLYLAVEERRGNLKLSEMDSLDKLDLLNLLTSVFAYGVTGGMEFAEVDGDVIHIVVEGRRVCQKFDDIAWAYMIEEWL